MGKKLKIPKLRHGWEINPKTRIVPNKKREPVVCHICSGFGTVSVSSNPEDPVDDCFECGGTGYAD